MDDDGMEKPHPSFERSDIFWFNLFKPADHDLNEAYSLKVNGQGMVEKLSRYVTGILSCLLVL